MGNSRLKQSSILSAAQYDSLTVHLQAEIGCIGSNSDGEVLLCYTGCYSITTIKAFPAYPPTVRQHEPNSVARTALHAYQAADA